MGDEERERKNAAAPWGWSEENLRKEGIAPATVIDVGAGKGNRGRSTGRSRTRTTC